MQKIINRKLHDQGRQPVCNPAKRFNVKFIQDVKDISPTHHTPMWTEESVMREKEFLSNHP